ncbi:MMPL family transporter [Nannocystis pusilla]|uniref:MMPL family transporter n=1 Tax=Nannocystis pusilla TaxID=889268 RepID=UPI003BF36240
MRDHPLVRARWAILALAVGVAALILPGLGRIREDNDVLAFLPPDHPDVVAFREVAKRFGVLEVGLVGLSKPDGDLLAVDRVDEVRELGREIARKDGVRMVLSFADLPDPRVTDDGLEIAELVPEALRDEAKIREKVLGSTDAVGTMVSRDGRAAALMVFLMHHEDRAAAADARSATIREIRETLGSGWKGESHLGGAPFIEDVAATASRADLDKLSPIVIGVLVLVSAVLLGSVVAAGINLVLTGLGVGLVLGAHGVFGEALTIVSSSMPVLMVALGGAFGVHMLAGYQRQSGTSRERASATLRELWLPVLLSGLTTAVSFFALTMMPQLPMQRFGVTAGVGVLVLLALALLVLPALLSVLPDRLMPPRTERAMPLRLRPNLWLLLLLALVGAGVASTLRADADPTEVFSEDSEPMRSNRFFNEHFGGSTYLQVAVEAAQRGDTDRKALAEPTALREIRDLAEQVRAIDGVVDVRSIVEPHALLNEALGGRRGVPETPGRASRVFALLQGHPAVAQLVTEDTAGALIHIKLAPMSGDQQVVVADAVRALLDRHATGGFVIAPTSDTKVRAVQVQEVGQRLSRILGRPVDADKLLQASPASAPSPALIAALKEVRDRALDSEDSPVEGVPREEIDAIDPVSLVTPRGAELEALLRAKLPTLAAKDPEGIGFVAKHLGPWADDALVRFQVEARCGALDLPLQAPADAAGPTCASVKGALSELDDDEWRVADGEGRGLSFKTRLTGQPVIGAAFAESVTRSLFTSTGVSLVGLALTLLLARQMLALVPAVWCLCVTMGIFGLLGMPISVGTSMISCIAVGAGVDFAIHLNFRARNYTTPDAGARAVDDIGVVTLISALQLAAAFLVLLASEMAPLRDLGLGLAIALVGAALGACWFAPWLARPGVRK